MDLKAVDLVKTFDKGKKVAVKGVSFEAYSGEVFGLLGPNGAGKTTTLRMLSTLLTPDQGEIYIGDNSISESPHNVRRNIGFLTSRLKPEEWFTPDYLFDFFAKLYGMKKSETAARKEELFSRFGIYKYKDVKVSKLSDGMKQKVSLVMSVVHDPGVVIFDEPTNGLDIVAARGVKDFLLEEKASGKTVIISTHIFDMAEKLCDRIGIIIDGKMFVQGTVDEVCRGEGLEKTFFDCYNDYYGESNRRNNGDWLQQNYIF